MLAVERSSALVIDAETDTEHPPEAEVVTVIDVEHSLSPGPEMEAVTVLLFTTVTADSDLVRATRKGRRC